MKKKVFHIDPDKEKKKHRDYSHLSAKQQAARMAEDYAKTPTANPELVASLRKYAEDYKE